MLWKAGYHVGDGGCCCLDLNLDSAFMSGQVSFKVRSGEVSHVVVDWSWARSFGLSWCWWLVMSALLGFMMLLISHDGGWTEAEIAQERPYEPHSTVPSAHWVDSILHTRLGLYHRAWAGPLELQICRFSAHMERLSNWNPLLDVNHVWLWK
jgi:hypothetical protein